MTRASKFGNRTTVAARGLLMTFIAGSVAAITYCRAAQRDEKNGYVFTAAMEWHKAAELMTPIPPVADFCWKQWERIMHLPRHLAQPIPAVAQAHANFPAIVVSPYVQGEFAAAA